MKKICNFLPANEIRFVLKMKYEVLAIIVTYGNRFNFLKLLNSI